MAVYGLREAADIDVYVAPEVFEQCRNSGEWEVRTWDYGDRKGDEWLKKGDVELYGQFWYEGKYYTFEELLPYTNVVKGVRVQPIYWLMNWKNKNARPKDLVDAALIGDLISTHPELVIEPK